MENENKVTMNDLKRVYNELRSVALIRSVPQLFESEYYDDVKRLLLTLAEEKDMANKEDRERIRKHYERYYEEVLNTFLLDLKSLVGMLNVDETNQSVVEDLKNIIESSLSFLSQGA